MPIDVTTTEGGINYSEKVGIPDTLNAKTGEETLKAASLNSDTQELLLRAQQNALEAKEAALGAINRFYQESKESEKKAGKMLVELEESLQLAISAAKESNSIFEKNTSRGLEQSAALPRDKQNSKVSKKISNIGNSPFSIFSGLKRSLLGTKPIEEEVKEEFYRLIIQTSPQLHQLIDELIEDKARGRNDKIIAKAKSEIAAARVAINKTQEELNIIREKAKKAFQEVEDTRKAAELIFSQINQDEIIRVADEIAQPYEEELTKEADSAAVQQAEEIMIKKYEEAVHLNNYAHRALTLAKKKVKKDAEELKDYKLQVQIALKKAQEETDRAKAETEAIRREFQEVLKKTALEKQQANADIEHTRRIMKEAAITAERQTYDKFTQEINELREEIDISNKNANDAISRAQGETQKAREELEMVKKSSEEAINKARQEALIAQIELERTKQSMFEIIGHSQEKNHIGKEEPELSLMTPDEAITRVEDDTNNASVEEIVESGQKPGTPKKSKKSGRAKGEQLGREKLDSDYMATVLHEMRTPLHSIFGFAKLLKEEDISDEATRKEFLSLMVQQSESLNKLIDDLSNVLNGTSETLSINKEPVSSYQTITEAIDSMRIMAEQKKIMITHNLNPTLPEIEADAFRIKQVITNLLTNAIKFSPENRPIFVKAGVKGGELIVQVIDYGIGVPEKELTAIFDKYYKAENRGDIEGAGLGLYICQQIVNAHGGRIWAESVEGEGSTFSFSLPITKVVQNNKTLDEKSYAGKDTDN
jgi:signal transduction histidine kinase